MSVGPGDVDPTQSQFQRDGNLLSDFEGQVLRQGRDIEVQQDEIRPSVGEVQRREVELHVDARCHLVCGSAPVQMGRTDRRRNIGARGTREDGAASRHRPGLSPRTSKWRAVTTGS